MAQKSFEWNANEQITLDYVQFARYLYELGSLRTMPQEEIE